MPSFSKPSGTQHTNATTNSPNGSATTSIPTQMTPSGSLRKLMLLPKNGRRSPLPSAPNVANPRPSPEGYPLRHQHHTAAVPGQQLHSIHALAAEHEDVAAIRVRVQRFARPHLGNVGVRLVVSRLFRTFGLG